MSNPKFEIRKAVNGQFYFNLKVGPEVVLTGETYPTVQVCRSGIAAVKENAPYDTNYERKDAPGNYRFNLKGKNYETIGTSEGYTSTAGRESGITSVKRNAPIADIVDLS